MSDVAKRIPAPSPAQDPRGGPLLDTPLSRLRPGPYAWLHRDLIERYGAGKGWHLVTLAAVASLIRRKDRTLGLDAREFAESTGLALKTTTEHLRRLEADGLADRDGEAWRPSELLREKAGKGHRAMVRFRNLPLLVAAIGGSGFRHMCWDRLYSYRRAAKAGERQRGRRRMMPISRLAERMGRSRLTTWRGDRTLLEAGITIAARFRSARERIETSLRRELKRAREATAHAFSLRRKSAVKPVSKVELPSRGGLSASVAPGGASPAECDERRRLLKAQAQALGATC